MPGVGFPRSPQDTRKTQDTPIPAVPGKTGGSAKSPGREFLMDYEKDKTGNFERGYS